MHGLDDNLVHPREAVALDERLRAAGVPAMCRLYEGTGHLFIIGAMSVPLRLSADTLTDVKQFVDTTMATRTGTKLEFGAPCTSWQGRKGII